jgi:hypothetical protein
MQQQAISRAVKNANRTVPDQNMGMARRRGVANPLVILILSMLLIYASARTFTFAGTAPGSSDVVTWAGQGSPGLKYGSPPEIGPAANANGEVRPGDLFLIDATAAPSTFSAVLQLINASALARNYSNFSLKVGVYQDMGAGKWEPISNGAHGRPGETYLTFVNTQASLALYGGTRYAITIDGGSYYNFDSDEVDGSAQPEFLLEVKL